jgi:site-specific DNA recombinase
MKAIIYIRVSTEDQGISPDFQRDKLIDHCNTNNLPYQIYEDIGVSGSKDVTERPGLSAAIDALKKGDHFIVYKLDRLARNLLLQLSIEELLIRKKCTLISIIGEGTDSGEYTPEKKLFKQIIAVFAEFERDQIKRRTKNALGQLKKNGKLYGKIPYGFRKIIDSSIPVQPGKKVSYNLMPCLSEQQIIDKIIFMRYTERLSHKAIVKTLNNQGITTRKGGTWQFKQVYNIVQNYKEQTNFEKV